MFYNYNLPDGFEQACCCSQSEELYSADGNLKKLYDVTGKFYGVEAKYQMPFTLYFHLDCFDCFTLADIVEASSVELSLHTKSSAKPTLTKTYTGASVYDSITQDLKIAINQEEASQLKQELYFITVKLVSADKTYIIHSDRSGILLVR